MPPPDEEWCVRLACHLSWRHYSTPLNTTVKDTTWSFGKKNPPTLHYVTQTLVWLVTQHLIFIENILIFSHPFFSTLYYFINDLIGLFLKTPFFSNRVSIREVFGRTKYSSGACALFCHADVISPCHAKLLILFITIRSIIRNPIRDKIKIKIKIY